MSNIKWIKLFTNIFDNRKIKQIEKLPEGDSIIIIWLKLLCLAGNINDNGFVYFSKDIPYTEEMLATEFGRPLNTVRMALTTFERFGMVEIVDDIYFVSGWEKYQNTDAMERVREQTRIRTQKYRARLKQEITNTNKGLPILEENFEDSKCDVTCDVTVTHCDETERRKKKEERRKEIEEKENKEIKETKKVRCQRIVDMFNSICESFPSVRTLSDARIRMIDAGLKRYTEDDFKKVFELAEQSSFMKGSSWASFDWMIKDANFAKILDGNYTDRAGASARPSNQPLNKTTQKLNEFNEMMREFVEGD